MTVHDPKQPGGKKNLKNERKPTRAGQIRKTMSWNLIMQKRKK